MKRKYTYNELMLLNKVKNNVKLSDKEVDELIGLQLAGRLPKKIIKTFIKNL